MTCKHCMYLHAENYILQCECADAACTNAYFIMLQREEMRSQLFFSPSLHPFNPQTKRLELTCRSLQLKHCRESVHMLYQSELSS